MTPAVLNAVWDENRLKAYAAFEKAVGRPTTDEEFDRIAEKNIRSGSSVFCTFKLLNTWFVFLAVAGSHYGPHAGKLTATGGGLHETNEDETQAARAATRELAEEIVSFRQGSILTIAPERLRKEHEAVDVSMLLPGANHPEHDIVMARNFSVVLGFQETLKLLSHTFQLKRDPVYARLCYLLADNEVGGLEVYPLHKAASDEVINRMRHDHEKHGLKNMAQRLLKHGA